MTSLVTGVAGFIGSHLAERLLSLGYGVVGVDRLSDYYNPEIKRSNLVHLIDSGMFAFIHKDVNLLTLNDISGVDVVFHLAAQPGVRHSWGGNFGAYVSDNILATQRLLELSKKLRLRRFVYASSSSVYGEHGTHPVKETDSTNPTSPYGVTKLAAENLCTLYHRSDSIPTVSLRYFTVYGPRQRPDMAFHRFIQAALEGQSITVFGTGDQRRDFTFISDVVDATIACIETECSGEIFNIAGGASVALNEVIRAIGELIGKSLDVSYESSQKGDLSITSADISLAEKVLSFRPKVRLRDGLGAEMSWLSGKKSIVTPLSKS